MESVKRWKHDTALNALTWHPTQNTLLVLDDQGSKALLKVSLTIAQSVTDDFDLPFVSDEDLMQLSNTYDSTTSTNGASAATTAATAKPTTPTKSPTTSSSSSAAKSHLPTGLSKYVGGGV
jgi:hypothetical protein